MAGCRTPPRVSHAPPVLTPPSPTAARIVARLAEAAAGARVADVRIGLGYTAVLLTDGSAGVAYTSRDLARGGCSVFDGRRPLAGRPALDLLGLLESSDAIEAAVGLGCANALGNRDGPDLVDGDVLDELDVGPDDDVGMVGEFGPLLEPLRSRAKSLTVFERVDCEGEGLRPADEAHERLGRCQVALITATSIVNHTVDGLLDAAAGCRAVALVGASTPLLPDAFGGRVTALSGILIQDAAAILQIVSEGGGMRQFIPHVRKVTRRVVR